MVDIDMEACTEAKGGHERTGTELKMMKVG